LSIFAALALTLSACASQQQQGTAVTGPGINAAYNPQIYPTKTAP